MDKRKDYRTKQRLKIKIGVDDVFTNGLTTDISMNGVGFVSKYTPKTKGVVIAMENGNKVTALVGKCVYVKHLREGSNLMKIGIELVSDSGDYEELIESLNTNNKKAD